MGSVETQQQRKENSMSDGPVANYVYKPWNDRPGQELGFNAVGPGWHPILKALDSMISQVLANSKVECSFKVVQIKEKFGGLRVYWDHLGMDEKDRHQITGAVWVAENMSYITCEKCGSFEGVDTRIKKDSKYGRVLTLCSKHHNERDNLAAKQVFEIGNGDEV
jgi:hypothetical protein